MQQAMEDVRRGVANYDIEHRVRRQDTGEVRVVQARGRFVRDAQGEVVKVYGFSRDITEWKRAQADLRREQALLQAVFDNIPVLLVLWDPHLERFALNPRAEAILGRSSREANEGDFMGMVYPDPAYRAEVSRYMQCLEPGFREWLCTTKSGEQVPIEWANVRLGDETAIGIGVDLRERKRIEEQLREANRRKDEFLATLAHELRNPLAPLRLASEVLAKIPSSDPRVHQICEMVERQVAHMSRLIEDLLDLNRIGRGRLELRVQRVELNPILEQAVELARPLIEQAGQRLEVSLPVPPVVLQADPVRLAQVFSNLLVNASKFTAPQGRIRLRARPEGSDVLVEVEDSGIGIPAEHLSSLFEMFHQVPGDGERARSGLGLGLPLVRGLVALHGGRVEARSDGVGQGSAFLVWLPVCVRAERSPAAEPERSPAPSRAS